MSTKKYIQLIDKIKEEQIEDEWWVYIYEIMINNKNKTELRKVKYRDFYLHLIRKKISFVNEEIFKFETSSEAEIDLPF